MTNSYGIKEIRFTKTVYPFCPMGNANYKAVIDVELKPSLKLFDFCEIDKRIEQITNGNFIIEAVAEEVWNIAQEYEPKSLIVKVTGETNGHFPVTVTKY